MILAEAAGQGTEIAAQAFFYIAIAVAVGYFGWQFYKGARENGGGTNYGWLTGPKKKDAATDATADDSAGPDEAVEADDAATDDDDASGDETTKP